MYPSLVICYFPYVWVILGCFWMKNVHGAFMSFSWMFFIVLDILAKNKKFGVLIQSFNLFHKVFVLCFFICIKCLNVLDIYLKRFWINWKGVRDGDGCVRINSLSHTPLACLKFSLKHPHKNFEIFFKILVKTGQPLSGGFLGPFVQLHKVLILLCICILAQKFTFFT